MSKKIYIPFIVFIISLIVFSIGTMVYISKEPPIFNVYQNTKEISKKYNIEQPAVGSFTVLTVYRLSDDLLNKRGGYISNDIIPPFIFVDNITNFEFGVLEIIRVTTSSFRKEMTRSQSQSIENPHMVIAQPKYSIDNKSWMFPNAQNEYRTANDSLISYFKELNGVSNTTKDKEIISSNYRSEFYARADNLAEVLSQYSNKLGSLSQRLSASIPSVRENIDLANDSAAEKNCPENYILLGAGACVTNDKQYLVKTPWAKVDDIFFQSRGQVYAMYHIMNALKYDFDKVIKDKNAEASFDQILRDLEATQQEIDAWFIMSSTGFGMFTNHSLIMSNYISRANAAIIDLVDLLNKG